MSNTREQLQGEDISANCKIRWVFDRTTTSLSNAETNLAGALVLQATCARSPFAAKA